MDAKKLAENGLVIYLKKNKFVLEKKKTELNQISKNIEEFDCFEEAVSDAFNFLEKKSNWLAIIRYNRGLGIEYRNISVLNIENKEEAKKIALKEAEKLVGNSIIEIKVSPSH